MATAKIQTVKGKSGFFRTREKILLGLDGLDSRNGRRTGIVFSGEMCYTWISKLTGKSEYFRCDWEQQKDMDAEIYSKQFYHSLGEISKSYKLKYSKNAFCVYKNLGDVFWNASFLCPSFLRDGQLEINVTNCLKPCAFDVVQFAIIDPEKKHRITDSLRVNASFKAGSLQIGTKTYHLTCGDPDRFSHTADTVVRTILEELIEKRTAFLSAVEKDGGLIQYLAHHWEENPLEGGMAYLCKHDYIAAKRCFELAEETHNIWLKSIGTAGRYLHLIFIEYCKAMQAGLEWTEALVENGFPGI